MLAAALLSALLPQTAAPSQAEVPADRWQAALVAVPSEQRAGLEFLLAHMPAADRAALDVELVLENLDYAYRAWRAAPWSDRIDRARFFNDVLPYASINERRDRWRKDFHDRLMPLVADAATPSEAAAILNREIFPLFGVQYSTQRPKADQSPYESIEAGTASCTGLSVLLVDACRAVGVPARLAGTPLWADGSGNHTWVEIWDDGWHFTGAAEPTGNLLDQAWFLDRAAQAVAGDPRRAIYATSWQATSRHFPMVWLPDARTVPAIDVTGRYTDRAPVPEGAARLRVLVYGQDGKRLACPVDVRLEGADEPLFTGASHGEDFDANDHLTAIVPLGAEVEVTVHHGPDRAIGFAVTEDDTRVRFVGSPAAMTSAVELPRDWLWREHAARVRRERAAEMEEKVLRIDGREMRFDYRVFGEKPPGGRSLYISLHGGGGAPPRVNDQQWENQKRLYEPAEGVYLAPRAPGDTWDLWHQAHVDVFLDRLIETLVVFEDVDPTRVYMMGYSAGGDGVFQLAPRMADRFAAAAMMAGHPNETRPDGLRNLPFTLHMGAEDAAYDRNLVAAEWKEQLAALQEADPGGYPHWVEIHADKGHWMDREDAAAVPWMAEHRLARRPQRIVWLQDDVVHPSFYWLHVDSPQPRTRVVVEREGQVFRILEADGIDALTLRMDEQMVSFAEEIVIRYGEAELFRGRISPDLAVMRRTLAERGSPAGLWTAEVVVSLKQASY